MSTSSEKYTVYSCKQQFNTSATRDTIAHAFAIILFINVICSR